MKRKNQYRFIEGDVSGLQVKHKVELGQVHSSLLFPLDEKLIKINSVIKLCHDLALHKPIKFSKTGLLYPGFQTFGEVMGEPPRIDLCRSIIKGIIKATLKVQREGIRPQISKNRLIAVGYKGSLLQTEVSRTYPSNSDCHEDFKSLAQLLEECVYGERPNKLKEDSEFQYLLKCLKEANTGRKRNRLMNCPYLLTPKEKVYDLIPLFYHLKFIIKGFADAIATIKNPSALDWKAEVVNFSCPEIRAVYAARGNYEDNASGFIDFLRHVVIHVNERRFNLIEMRELREKLLHAGTLGVDGLVIEDLMVAKNVSRQSLPPMMKAPSEKYVKKLLEMVNQHATIDPLPLDYQPIKLLDLIESVWPDLLSMVFYETYNFDDMGSLDLLSDGI